MKQGHSLELAKSSSTASNKPAIIRQLKLASRRLNASCQLCEISDLCNQNTNSEPDLIHFKRGDIIFRHGEQGSYLYSVRKGSIKTLRHRAPGEDQILSFYFAGELFGFDSLSTCRRQNEAVATEDCVLCRLPMHHLTSGQLSNEAFYKVLQLFGNDALHFQEHAALVNRRQASARLAAFLLNVASRIINKHQDIISFQLPMSRYDIASYLGLSMETVSRRFSELERNQLLSIEGQRKTIHILDLAGLQKIALS